MKPTRPEQNWTPYPNNILDNLDFFTGNEFKVLSLMIRKNLGYDDPNMQFSISYVCLKTGLSKPTAINAIDTLLEKGTIRISGSDKRGTRLFDVNWNEPVKKFARSKNFTSTGKKSLPVLVKKFDPLKENTLKENRKRKQEAPEYLRLATLLMNLHKAEDEKYTVSESRLNTWAKDIRLLSTKDGRDLPTIEAVIRWAKTPGEFWFPNIMSGKKLREKFPTLLSQMSRSKPKRSENDLSDIRIRPSFIEEQRRKMAEESGE